MMYFNTKRKLSSNGTYTLYHEVVQPVKKKNILSRIKWVRLIVALMIIFGFGYGVISMGKGVISAYPAWKEERNERYIQNELKKYETVEVTIWEGDTAWDIQQKLTPNEHDLRHPLYLASKLNGGVDWGNLIPGETYIFLKEKSRD